MNAQQRRVDVWLLYRCVECDATWKHTIFERCAPEDIGDDLYACLLQNDAATAHAYACDIAALRGSGARIDDSVAFRVHVSPDLLHPTAGGWRIALDVSSPCSVRLDRLLVHTLGVSRAEISRWASAGILVIQPHDRRALTRPARHGQIVLIRRSAL